MSNDDVFVSGLINGLALAVFLITGTGAKQKNVCGRWPLLSTFPERVEPLVLVRL